MRLRTWIRGLRLLEQLRQSLRRRMLEVEGEGMSYGP